MAKHPLAGLDKTHWGSWLQPLDRFTLFDLIKTLSSCSASTTNIHSVTRTCTEDRNTCILYNWLDTSCSIMKGQNGCVTYVNKGASYSGWSNLGRAMQRLILFSTDIRLHLAERCLERQACPAIWNSIVWGNVDSMDDSTKQASKHMGEGLGLMLKRPEPNSCYTKAPKSFLCGEVERQKGGGKTRLCLTTKWLHST